PDTLSEENFVRSALFYFPVFLFAILIAYLTTGRRQDAMESLSRSAPHFHDFIQKGYGTDRFVELIVRNLTSVGASAQSVIDFRFYDQLAPKGTVRVFQRTSELISRLDQKLSESINVLCKKSTDAPARLL